MTLTDNLVANGNIVVSSVQTNNVLGGLVFDQSTRRLNLSYLTWTFEVEGGVMMPLGKTRVEFTLQFKYRFAAYDGTVVVSNQNASLGDVLLTQFGISREQYYPKIIITEIGG